MRRRNTKNSVSAIGRIAITIGLMVSCVLLLATPLGLVPDDRSSVIEGRAKLSETIAINSSLLISQGDFQTAEVGLETVVGRHADIVTAAIRRNDGSLLVEVGDHEPIWRQAREELVPGSTMLVPVVSGEDSWGSVEITFEPLRPPGLSTLLAPPVPLYAFTGGLSVLLAYLYLRRVLQHLDPSSVVPTRVKAALDSLVEGLVLLDNDERIVLANQAFADTMGESWTSLQGRRLDDFDWEREMGADADSFPWTETVETGVSKAGYMLGLLDESEDSRTFVVNSTPVADEDGSCRGVLASFDDVTQLENKKTQLAVMLEKLKKSTTEIHRQNRELQLLATRDPLTNCLNRRSFFEQFDSLWKTAQRYDRPLSCIMADIDLFKSINDQHGHSVGDTVLVRVGQVLRESCRDADLVCRYGGEEFCVLLPEQDIVSSAQVAEKLRKAVAELKFDDLSVTMSFGVSSNRLGASDPQEVLDQADKCLYVAKRSGRNQIVGFDDVPDDLDFDVEEVTTRTVAVDTDVDIPFHAVSALLSALAYRDAYTAEHSCRVADMCVAVANGLMTQRDAYILEIAALLHDVGKIGVPDSILLKPGKLTREEWEVMKLHDLIGVEIISTTFACADLAQIIRTHHASFGSQAIDDGLPHGKDIPLGARIITIADAFDAMISDRVYRKGRSVAEAVAELRRCGGTQFDPELVERFVEILHTRKDFENSSLARLPRQAALRIGTQIETLADAVDAHDIARIAELAQRLQQTADDHGIEEMTAAASKLASAAVDDCDLAQLVETTNELMELCRATHRSYIDYCPNLASDWRNPERFHSISSESDS